MLVFCFSRLGSVPNSVSVMTADSFRGGSSKRTAV